MKNLDLEKAINDIINEMFEENSSEEIENEASEGEENIEKSKMNTEVCGDADKIKIDEKIKIETDDPKFPKQINSFDEKTGKIKDESYESVQEANSGQPTPEAKQVEAAPIKKSIEISEEDYQILEKAKKEQEEESLKKAKEEQIDLIKAAVSGIVSEMKAENEELKKSLAETRSLVEKIASQPREPKAIIDALETITKSQTEGSKEESLSKSEIQDVANELAINKSYPEFGIEHATEVERALRSKEGMGALAYMEPHARQAFEIALKKRGK